MAILVNASQAAGAKDAPDPSSGGGNGPRKSISGWVSCGAADQGAGVAKAFAAARHGAFTLVVDCPVGMKIGMDIGKTLFIDDGTTVEFTGSGKFTVDNVFIPAFVLADTSNVTLLGWNVEYDGGLPLDQNTGGYQDNGEFVKGPKPANAFNDIRLKGWLAANRGIDFDKRDGNVNPPWTGVTNACAVFYFTGDTSKVKVSGLHLYAPESAGGDRFVPVAFALGLDFKRNQSVTSKTPITGEYYAVPHGLEFTDIHLDGTYMGWVGGTRDAVFEHIRSDRYGDLQDADGGTVGGVGKWFAPPHLFYFGYSITGDPGLFNDNIRIRDVVDNGLRAGKARDSGPALSGNALSLKLGCVNCSVDNYRTQRPDGFLDVLSSDGLTISNVSATYDSSFLNNLYPGWRFPSPSYRNVKFDHITLVDKAPVTVQAPIGNAGQASNQGISMSHVRVIVNRWSGSSAVPLPAIAGQASLDSVKYSATQDASHAVRSRAGSIEITLSAAPGPSSNATVVTWTAREATHCSASGAWSGPIGTSGSVTVKTAGARAFELTCGNAGESATSTLELAADQ